MPSSSKGRLLVCHHCRNPWWDLYNGAITLFCPHPECQAAKKIYRKRLHVTRVKTYKKKYPDRVKETKVTSKKLHAVPIETRICKNEKCGMEFPAMAKTQVFCSEECRHAYWNTIKGGQFDISQHSYIEEARLWDCMYYRACLEEEKFRCRTCDKYEALPYEEAIRS